MNLPPAASWSVGHAPWQRGALSGHGLMGALGGLYFCLNQRWGVSSWLILLALCVSAAGAAIGLHRGPAGQLKWDGERWHLSDAEDYAVTRLACVLDLQGFLLLRIDCARGPRIVVVAATPPAWMHAGWHCE